MSRTLWSVVVAVLVVLSVPVGAGARPPISLGAAVSLPPLTAPDARTAARGVVVPSLTSAPAAARAGDTYVLRGAIVNEASVAYRRLVVVHLLRVGSPPVAVGKVSLRVPAHDLVVYRVRVRLPHVLHDGSYALVACARQSCATAERHLRLGPAGRASHTLVRSTAGICSSGAHSLSSPGSHVYPETATAATRACTPTSS